MSPWGTTIATLAIPLSTLQDASLLPHLTYCALCSRCETIATLDPYFANRSVISKLSSGYCQPCLILYHLHRSPQSATLDHTISFLSSLSCIHWTAHINQHDEEYYREPHHTADCAKFFQWHILLPTVQQQQKSSVEELGRLWGGLMDFQPGADDYLCDRGQIFEYTIHMSIHRWCHLIASQMLKYFETLYILHKSCLVFDCTGW